MVTYAFFQCLLSRLLPGFHLICSHNSRSSFHLVLSWLQIQRAGSWCGAIPHSSGSSQGSCTQPGGLCHACGSHGAVPVSRLDSKDRDRSSHLWRVLCYVHTTCGAWGPCQAYSRAPGEVKGSPGQDGYVIFCGVLPQWITLTGSATLKVT